MHLHSRDPLEILEQREHEMSICVTSVTLIGAGVGTFSELLNIQGSLSLTRD